jgi:multidrug efflux pump subunit AcrA (membrane-fusion protein)
VADTNRKTIQHLDGGIIAEILVRDGDHVAAGQTLMRLDDLETRSTVTLLEDQRRAYTAQEARLLAERDGRNVLVFPQDLESLRGGAQMDEILTGQQRIFESYRASLQGRIEVTRQRIAQYGAQIRAFEAQLDPDRAGDGRCAGAVRQGAGTQAAPARAQARRCRVGRRAGRVLQQDGPGP